MTKINGCTLRHERYLGDGAYVGWDGFHVWVYASDGVAITQKVGLEPDVLKRLTAWLDEQRQREKLNG